MPKTNVWTIWDEDAENAKKAREEKEKTLDEQKQQDRERDQQEKEKVQKQQASDAIIIDSVYDKKYGNDRMGKKDGEPDKSLADRINETAMKLSKGKGTKEDYAKLMLIQGIVRAKESGRIDEAKAQEMLSDKYIDINASKIIKTDAFQSLSQKPMTRDYNELASGKLYKDLAAEQKLIAMEKRAEMERQRELEQQRIQKELERKRKQEGANLQSMFRDPKELGKKIQQYNNLKSSMEQKKFLEEVFKVGDITKMNANSSKDIQKAKMMRDFVHEARDVKKEPELKAKAKELQEAELSGFVLSAKM